MSKRTLSVLLLLVLLCFAGAFAEENTEQPEATLPVFECKELGVSFLVPMGAKAGDDLPCEFTAGGVTFHADLRVVPGDLNTFRELMTDEMIGKGWQPKGQLTVIYKTTEVIEYRFIKDGADLFMYLYPYAQGGHRFFYILCTGENLAEKKAKVIEPVVSTVTVKDVLKDNPPKDYTINLKEAGFSVTCPWYWRMRPTSGALKLSFSVFYSMKFYNHINVYYFPGRESDPEKDAAAWLNRVKKHPQFRLIGDSPRKISGCKGVELEYIHQPSDKRPEIRRERVMFLYRNNDLFRIEFITLYNTWQGGLDDYLKFLGRVKIEPREDEKAKDDKEKGENEGGKPDKKEPKK